MVHAGHLLAGGQALAHDGDRPTVRGSLLLPEPRRQQKATTLQDVRRLGLDLEPWRDTQAVRELDEQLATVGGAS